MNLYDQNLCDPDCPGGPRALKKMRDLETALTFVVPEIREDLRDIKKNMVSRSEFAPVQRIVYGAVALVLIAFGTAVISLVVAAQQ